MNCVLAGGLIAMLTVPLVAASCGSSPAATSPPNATEAAGSPVSSATASPSPSPVASPSPTPSATPPTPGSGPARPNAQLTPGEVFPTATAARICVSGYSGAVRHVTRDQYVRVYEAYGIPYPQPPGAYELDHLIPLELGGDNANANLWPEAASPAPGFHQKDVLENALHQRVCSGGLDLSSAQHEIATDWSAAYQKYVTG